MFIKRGQAGETIIGVEAVQVGTVPVEVEGEIIQEPIYDITRCHLVQSRTKRIATQADRRSKRQVMPSEIAGDLTVSFRFPDGEVVTVTLDESQRMQSVKAPRTPKASTFLPSITIKWKDRSKRGR